MIFPQKQFKLSGRVSPQDTLHQITVASAADTAPDEHYIAPTTVAVNIIVPAGHTPIGVPQYAATVVGGSAAGYDPAGDCSGYFMSCNYQPNNNCYAYACNITTNTFPQPGRQSGYLLTADDMRQSVALLGQTVSDYASNDGLAMVGTAMIDVLEFKSTRQGTTPPGQVGTGSLGGHFVALMVSPAGDSNWPGDYHWARCDNSSGACDSWSQKDGNDQVTNFDFAGNAISDPSTANWTVNQGPITASPQQHIPPDLGQDQFVTYKFYCFMFVPDPGVNGPVVNII